MENTTLNNEKIYVPQITCFILIILYFFILLFSIREILGLFIYSFFNILFYLIILILVIIGIEKKNYKYYYKGLIISLILSIFLTIIKIIIIIIITIDELKNFGDLSDTNYQMAIYMYIFTIFINWILTRILFLYKNDVEKYCLTLPTIQNLINENNES